MKSINADVANGQNYFDNIYLYEYINKEVFSAVLFIGIDNFKYINNYYGYKFGNCLLKQINLKLQQEIGNCGKVFRFLGDKFIVILKHCTENEIISKARYIVKKFQTKQFYIEESEILLTIRIGIYIPDKKDESSDDILRKAEIALFKAKSNGKSRIAFYDKPMEDEIRRKIVLASEMRKSIEENELYAHYQPIFDINEGKITEVEALLRWESRIFGSIPPLEFVPLAEENGLINEMGFFVMESVFKQMKLWEKEGLSIKVAINISPLQLLSKGFSSKVKKLVQEFDIDYKRIKFEITETQILKHERGIIKYLNAMLKAGLEISLDDFGVGYTSIKNMVLLPVSEIKIDKSFIDKLLYDKKTEVIVQSIIDTAKKLGYKITAEGVETKGQFEKLKHMKCDKIQGYYISQPVPPEEIADFI